MSEIAEIGRYKLAYLDEDQGNLLRSDMFDTFKDMTDHVQNQHIDHYLMMEATKHNGTHYEWNILPNRGLYWPYRIARFVFDHAIEIGLIALAVGLFIYYHRKNKMALAAPAL